MDKEKLNLKGFFWKLCSQHKLSLFCFAFCAGFVGLHGLINSFFIKKIIDALSKSNSNFLLGIGVCVTLNFELHNLCWRAINYLTLKKAPLIKSRIIEKAFADVHNQPVQFFDEQLSGSVANDIKVLADETEKVFFSISIRLIRGIVQFVAALISMYFVHLIFSVVLLVWASVFVSVSLFFSRKIVGFSDSYAKIQSQASGRIFDSISNFFTVKIFSREKEEIGALKSLLMKVKSSFQKRGWFLLKFYFAQGFSITALIGAMIFFLIRFQIKGLITVGEFAYILGATFYVTEYLWTFTENLDQINDALGNCQHSYSSLLSLAKKEQRKDLVIKKGGISFQNLHFSYESFPLFTGLSIEIAAGEKVGIVGRSGSGKTTFAKLILHLYELQSGAIFIDGQDISEISLSSLRQSISLIPQIPSLFNRTIWENIAYSKQNASMADVVEAAKRAQIHDFIVGLPNGYETVVGEQGIRLSGGQRQRVALARGFIKQAPILILDEATSQLDSITEKAIQKELFSMMDGRTTIVIAHRLSTLSKMDRILVFDRGKIIEEGTHAQMLKKRGVYHALWAAQSSDRKVLENMYNV
ncbi:MAG: ABC transporter ATP-binding protein [Candidatus Algichlamydia australiensis]|nr:ABC transporter ATP-binding protein [Chlamydiales bacterium]